MASTLAALRADAEATLEAEFFKQTAEANFDFREREEAARKIQACIRGYTVRAHFQRYKAAVIVIQSAVRGMTSRRLARQLAQERNTQQRLNFFNTCAVEIQKHWRGFASRKFVHSFYARKQWLARVMKASEDLREEIAEAIGKQAQDAELLAQMEFTNKFQAGIRGKHHLLSTKVRPGIYNSPYAAVPGGSGVDIVDGKLVEDHLRNTLRKLACSRPNNHDFDSAVQSLASTTVKVEKPKFVNNWQTQYAFDDYNQKLPRGARTVKTTIQNIKARGQV
mmetsp:Transcript_29370/g.56375  ORF Transcript_29370/g.56375 Transcript_29370/m.56375 type:complete len:279 (-) Transcript_29370:435-1271(-)|eukprot:CAMPEP_0114230470 /NCGR_PEP_ID=MMETSP0058-20121206/3489_1 /TAXON_ID=36894 /ORGANISM="Pyramimonas parkeae, CCMP726" /LENGTH=278 /DNA_ID=CAMNT_0001341677 /DNA_START=476 /DNA_END=1312 /DNA_ORIENTATION=+